MVSGASRSTGVVGSICDYQPVVTEHGQFAAIVDHLDERGLAEAEVDAILGGNVVDLYRAVAG